MDLFKAKHVLITGGASGLGLGCALKFAAAGACVTIADIDQQGGQQAAASINAAIGREDACSFAVLDLSSTVSIDGFASKMAQGPIDVLVNNAGIYPPSQLALTAAGQEVTFAIAYLGHFRLTAALWPALVAAESARVIGVTSMVQRKAALCLDEMANTETYVPIRAYERAKLACLMFSLELDMRCQQNGVPVRSVAVHPGVCRSNLGANRKVQADDSAWQRLMTGLQGYGLRYFGRSAAAAASVALVAAQSDIVGAPFFAPTGPFEAFGKVGPCVPGDAAADLAQRQDLWNYAQQTLGMKFDVTGNQ